MSKKSHSRWLVARLVAFTAAALVITTLVATTLLDLNVGSTSDFRAVFTNASGLQSGDTVRIAGVQTGRVSQVSLSHGQAVVSFNLSSGQHLTTTTRAEIHYENLLGQRFLALIPGSSPGRPLPSGATIPTSRTSPALNLTAVFNGFQPLFSALTPNQVNALTDSLIQVLQGQGGTLTSLAQQVAVLTDKLADKQQIIDQLVDNLSGVLGTVGAHDKQLGQMIDSFTSVVKSLAGERGELGSTINGVKSLTKGVSHILSQSQPDLNKDISGLSSFSATLAQNQKSLDATIRNFPGLVTTLTKVMSTGSYLNIYICNLTIVSSGSVDISLVPGVPAPQPGDPLTIPSGAVGDQSEHTANCG
jgi:phospholipid/cholesterol/gamma-HCH transport system substrate-binding protein